MRLYLASSIWSLHRAYSPTDSMNEQLRTRKGTNMPKMVQPWWWVRPEPISPCGSEFNSYHPLQLGQVLAPSIKASGDVVDILRRSPLGFLVSGWLLGIKMGQREKHGVGIKETGLWAHLVPIQDLSDYISVPQQI